MKATLERPTPPPPPAGKVVLEMTEEEAKLLTTLVALGVRWSVHPFGPIAEKVYEALTDAGVRRDHEQDSLIYHFCNLREGRYS